MNDKKLHTLVCYTGALTSQVVVKGDEVKRDWIK
jgi:hypothetical protein